MGSPTIVADITSPSPTSQIAARLLDVDPASGNETLVARGLYRPEINSGTEATRQVFQLHPNGWKFAAGHVAKLELLPADQPYGRNSNGQAPVTVSNLELRLPVLEQPGARRLGADAGAEGRAAGLPARARLRRRGYPRPKGATPLRVSLVPAYQQCSARRTASTARRSRSRRAARRSSRRPTSRSARPTRTARPRTRSGSVRLGRSPATRDAANEADVALDVSITDVRNQTGPRPTTRASSR